MRIWFLWKKKSVTNTLLIFWKLSKKNLTSSSFQQRCSNYSRLVSSHLKKGQRVFDFFVTATFFSLCLSVWICMCVRECLCLCLSVIVDVSFCVCVWMDLNDFVCEWVTMSVDVCRSLAMNGCLPFCLFLISFYPDLVFAISRWSVSERLILSYYAFVGLSGLLNPHQLFRFFRMRVRRRVELWSRYFFHKNQIFPVEARCS